MRLCACMCVPSYLCVEVMIHLRKSRHRKTKRKVREKQVSEFRGGLCFLSSVYKAPLVIQLPWKKNKNNTVCTVPVPVQQYICIITLATAQLLLLCQK